MHRSCVNVYFSAETVQIHVAVSGLLNNIQMRCKRMPDAFVLCRPYFWRSYPCCFISPTVTHTLFPTKRVWGHEISASAGTILVIVLREINVSTTATKTTANTTYIRIYLRTTKVRVALRDAISRQPNALLKRLKITFSIKIMSLQRKFVIRELLSRNMQMHYWSRCTFIFIKY